MSDTAHIAIGIIVAAILELSLIIWLWRVFQPGLRTWGESLGGFGMISPINRWYWGWGSVNSGYKSEDRQGELVDKAAALFAIEGEAGEKVSKNQIRAASQTWSLPPTEKDDGDVEVTLLEEGAGFSTLLREWFGASGRLLGGLGRTIRLEAWLFALALVIYTLTRLWGLTDFPIYFFTDEAIQTVSAENLLQNQLRSPEGIFLPTYFQNGSYFNLSLSVYVQLLPTLLFGKSVFVTRAVSVFISFIGVWAVGITLRDIYKARYWWAGTLMFSIVPAWFLHSRTAFETVLFVSMYAVMLHAYLLYRYRNPRFLFLAIFMAGLSFYSYNPGQLLVVVTWVLFLFSDLPYHWKNRRLGLPAVGLILLLALPYLRFRWQSNFEPQSHLTLLGSYWMTPTPLNEKLARFWQEYLRGLSPAYWFFPNEHDLPRHLMKGYGHLSGIWMPFAAVGLLNAVWKWRFSVYRNLILILLVAPSAAALVGIGITRVLVFIIPAVLLITLGLELVLGWLEKALVKVVKACTYEGTFKMLSVFLAIGLCWANIAMLRDALINGSTWYEDYGLGGLQYGAQQLFPEVIEYLEENPDQELLISPNWTNGADVVARFFLPEGLPVRMGNIEGYMFEQLPLDEGLTLVMIPEELEKTIASGKFRNLEILRTLYFPNHKPGFIFVKLRYTENIAEILEEEREARRELQADELIIDGQTIGVRYSLLDMGTIQHIFDGDLNTVASTLEANPFVIELSFPEGTFVNGYSMTTGSSGVRVSVNLYADQDADPIIYTKEFKGSVAEPGYSVTFGHDEPIRLVRFEILEVGVNEPAHVHVWEIDLR